MKEIDSTESKGLYHNKEKRDEKQCAGPSQGTRGRTSLGSRINCCVQQIWSFLSVCRPHMEDHWVQSDGTWIVPLSFVLSLK